MKPVPYFTLDELRAAFRLVVSDEEAERRARGFFKGAEVDEDGFFLWRPWGLATEDEAVGDEHAILYDSPSDAEGTGTGGYEVFRGKSDREKAELLLTNFSDFTLSLVSLVSEEAATRIQHIRRDSDAQARRAADQMRLIVRVIGRDPPS